MKNILFLIIFYPALTYSQSIFTGDMLWSTMDGPGNCCDGDPCTSYYTRMTNDTSINGTQYKRVENTSDSLMNTWTLAGFMREEGQKVYFRKKNNDSDCLLYDFGCSVGDTLNLDCSCLYNYKFRVDSMKYLPVMEKSRKHIYLTYLINHSINGSVETWIDGIGSTNGILNGGGGNNCMIGFYERLLCCFKENRKIYNVSGCDVCYIGIPNGNSKYEYPSSNSNLKLYPNPASDYIYIETADISQEVYIEILSPAGIIECTERIANCRERIDIGNLRRGIYIIRISDKDGYTYSKFIKL